MTRPGQLAEFRYEPRRTDSSVTRARRPARRRVWWDGRAGMATLRGANSLPFQARPPPKGPRRLSSRATMTGRPDRPTPYTGPRARRGTGPRRCRGAHDGTGCSPARPGYGAAHASQSLATNRPRPPSRGARTGVSKRLRRLKRAPGDRAGSRSGSPGRRTRASRERRRATTDNEGVSGATLRPGKSYQACALLKTAWPDLERASATGTCGRVPSLSPGRTRHGNDPTSPRPLLTLAIRGRPRRNRFAVMSLIRAARLRWLRGARANPPDPATTDPQLNFRGRDRHFRALRVLVALREPRANALSRVDAADRPLHRRRGSRGRVSGGSHFSQKRVSMPSVDSFPAPSADGHHANRVVLEMHSDSVAIVSLFGEHDLGHYEQLKVAFDTAAVRRRNLVVDLSGCAFIDSTVISLLLTRSARSRVTEAGSSSSFTQMRAPSRASPRSLICSSWCRSMRRSLLR